MMTDPTGMEGFWAGVWSGIKQAPGGMWNEAKSAVMHPIQTSQAFNNASIATKAKMGFSANPAIAGVIKVGEIIHTAVTDGPNAAGKAVGDHLTRGLIEVGTALATEGAVKGLGTLRASEGGLSSLFEGGSPKASALTEFAEGQGWKATQSESGPLKFIDENGINRMTLKEGSARTPGSGEPHVELKDASGQRINPAGEPVTRKSPENHTKIEWDLK